jgi:hypothetical protein
MDVKTAMEDVNRGMESVKVAAVQATTGEESAR